MRSMLREMLRIMPWAVHEPRKMKSAPISTLRLIVRGTMEATVNHCVVQALEALENRIDKLKVEEMSGSEVRDAVKDTIQRLRELVVLRTGDNNE